MNKSNLPYRPCAGMMLINRKNQVFVGQRIDTTMEAWQMPQGGIDEGEDAKRAALRELKEEIGTDKVEIVARTQGWLLYDLPDDLIGKVWGGKYRGQKQKWFLMRFLGRDDDINLETHHPEFSSWKWSALEDVPEMAVPFKRQLYRSVIEEFQKYF
ncbi:MAG: RNA pyrophosphohydrolase [Sphingomonadales bacterium]